MSSNAKIALWLVLGLVLSACGQSVGPAPVVYGGTGETIQTRQTQAVVVGQTVTVRKGDALYKIAKHYNVGLRSLIDINGLKPPYTIFPGQKLRLPSSGVHVVKRGETVYQIASRYNTEPGALVRLNRISPPYRLYSGQKLAVPGNSTRQAAPVTRTSTAKVAQQPRRNTRQSAPSTRRQVLPPEPRTAKRAPVLRPNVKPPAASRGGFIWPVNGRVLSRFGTIGKGLQNDGINILARQGTPVRAVQNGVVAYAGNELRGFGNLLLIKHSGGWISAYAHNSELLVRTGQKVRRGQVISKVGRTGSVDKPQLHFELRRGNRAVDPERYLGRRTAAIRR